MSDADYIPADHRAQEMAMNNLPHDELMVLKSHSVADSVMDELAKVLRSSSCVMRPKDCTEKCNYDVCDCSGEFRHAPSVSAALARYDALKETT